MSEQVFLVISIFDIGFVNSGVNLLVFRKNLKQTQSCMLHSQINVNLCLNSIDQHISLIQTFDPSKSYRIKLTKTENPFFVHYKASTNLTKVTTYLNVFNPFYV